MEQKIFSGFGEEHTLKEWARRLGIRVGVLSYLVETVGKSVEEIAAFCGKQYPAQGYRQRHEGPRMTETRDIITELLRRSGYTVEPAQVGVTYAYRTIHVITYAGRLLGQYNYATGVLAGGANGRTLKLNRSGFYPDNTAPRIRLLNQGGWERVRVSDVADVSDAELRAYYNARAAIDGAAENDREG